MRHGILLVDKPAGITSHDAVQAARKHLRERKIGHLGTLDPLATGLLVLFVGRKALKTVELFKDSDKEYEARIRFGAISSTDDAEGVIENVPERAGWSPPKEMELMAILREKFLGTIRQTPPCYSAVHVHGKRAYEVIRRREAAQGVRPPAGQAGGAEWILQLPEREVEIRNIQLVSYAYPHALLKIACGSGTYVRSIARDLGRMLRCGAYLDGLRRTRVGFWKLGNAQSLKNIAWAHVIPLKDVLADFPRCELSEEQWRDAQHGRLVDIAIENEPAIAWFDGLPVAILERTHGKAHPRKML